MFANPAWTVDVTGVPRQRTLTIHHGWHTFISHALAGGRKLAEVRAAAGHSNVAITSGYLHGVVDEDEGVGKLFSLTARICTIFVLLFGNRKS